MNHSYKKQIVDMLVNEWDLGKTRAGAKGKTAGWIYLYEILEESEELVFEIDNGKVIGICGYAKWNSKKYIFRKKFYHILKLLLMHSPMIKNKEEMYKYHKNYNYTPENMKGYFDGEISILILNNDYRGKGIGKKMILEIFEKAKNSGMKNIQILTDESSNYKFYEHLGCKKVYETTIYSGEPSGKKGNFESQGYVYEKKLN